MKAVILAAGKGSRMKMDTRAHSKCMICLEGKPILLRSVEYLASFAFFDEVIIVVGHDAKYIIQEVGYSCNGKDITYVLQETLNGIIGAMEVVKEAVGLNNFYIQLGDEVFLGQDIVSGYEVFNKEHLDSLFGVVYLEEKERVRNCYTIEYDTMNRPLEFVEKPKVPFNNICGTGSIFFRNKVFGYLDELTCNEKGNRDLVMLLTLILHKTGKIDSYVAAKQYVNINSQSDLEYLTKVLLGEQQKLSIQ